MALVVASLRASAASVAHSGLPLERIEVPEGVTISVYVKDVADARSMALGKKGTLFIGSRKAGRVYVVRDTNGDGRGDGVRVLAEGLRMPNGVAYDSASGDLYVAEIGRALRFDQVEETHGEATEPVVVREGLPQERAHGWRYMAFGPDGWLYLGIGAPCNVCLSDDKLFATISRFRPSGGPLEVFASGVRNTVGFDWHPRTAELWFTDNGRDWMGDSIPPDELNRAPEPGLHFGFPYCHGASIPDPKYGEQAACTSFVAPVHGFPAHVAALGMHFYTGALLPERFHGRIFVAEHGSWNRSNKVGYRVTTIEVSGDGSASYEVFASGWLQGESAWGRPVDIVQTSDGALLVSDDHAGAVYRISR